MARQRRSWSRTEKVRILSELSALDPIGRAKWLDKNRLHHTVVRNWLKKQNLPHMQIACISKNTGAHLKTAAKSVSPVVELEAALTKAKQYRQMLDQESPLVRQFLTGGFV